MLRGFCCLLLSCMLLPAAAQPNAAEPKTPVEWFQRAGDRMNLRAPGSAPFHMKVTFHAFPGQELLGAKEKSNFVAGDGVYEETWLSPHEWRREITLADYHAIEEDSAGTRKMQASSDYEPSRVLMLLDALYNPVPRYLVSKEFPRAGWKIDHIANANLSLVRISRSVGDERADVSSAYYFLPQGVLAIKNAAGLTTTWASDFLFSGIVVPRHISVKAGERELLAADVSVEAEHQANPATFDIPGDAAAAGMTLRPFQVVEIKMPDLSDGYSWVKPGRDTTPSVFSFWAVLDRHGKYREAEVILAPNENDAAIILAHVRETKYRPAEIDGSACQIQLGRVVM